MLQRLADSELLLPIALLSGVFWSAILMAAAATRIAPARTQNDNAARTILTNSAIPIAARLANRAVDLLFAAFMLRQLGVAGSGQYALAVVVWLYVKTISDFGLGVLTTREVARDPTRAGHLLGATTLLRLCTLLALAPFVALYAVGGLHWFNLSTESAIAIGLQILGIVPGSYTEAVNSVFNGHERMAKPALLNVLTNFSRAGFGLAALLAGWGVIGLGAVALVSTSLAALAFHLSVRRLGIRPRWSLERRDGLELIQLAWPLLLNALLLNLFFRADVLIIQASQGDTALGTYDAAYKYVNMLLLLPAYFTLAVFPTLTRHASAGPRRLIESFSMSAKLLLILAWPITLGTMLMAPLLIRILGGEAFLPGSADALRVLIWFLPLSYVNGVVQYVLIAVNRQRTISIAFLVAVIFNLGANLALVPIYGYLAAAAVTVATEVALFIPLAIAFHRHIGWFDWLGFASRPSLAAAAMGVALLATSQYGLLAPLVTGLVVYLIALIVAGAVGRTEAEVARSLIGRSRPAAP